MHPTFYATNVKKGIFSPFVYRFVYIKTDVITDNLHKFVKVYIVYNKTIYKQTTIL